MGRYDIRFVRANHAVVTPELLALAELKLRFGVARFRGPGITR